MVWGLRNVASLSLRHLIIISTSSMSMKEPPTYLYLPFTSQIKTVSRYKAVQANQTSHAIQNGRSREQTHLLTIFNCGHPGDPEATSWRESAIRLHHHHHHHVEWTSWPSGGHPTNKSSSSNTVFYIIYLLSLYEQCGVAINATLK